jgi:hypothetical protein
MRVSRAIVFVTLFAIGCGAASNLSGGGNPTDIAGPYEEATEILKTVTDKETAESASPKLAQVGAKLRRRYDAAVKKYPDLTTDIGKLPEKDQEKLKKAMAGYQEESIRVMNLEDGGPALQAFTDATGRMELGVKGE